MRYDIIQDYLSDAFRLYGKNECVRYQGRSYTYSELEADAERAAAALQETGVRKGDFVGVFLADRYHLIVSMVGIWKAGAVFVPFDQEYPMKRLAEMAESCGIRYIIRDENAVCSELEAVCPEVNGLKYAEMQRTTAEFRDPKPEPADPAYLYFTSGTTGKPKPIMGVNRSLAHFIDWEIAEFGIEAGMRVSQVTPPCHDPFLRDVLVPLFAGGVSCIPEKREHILSGERLAEWIDGEQIALIHCTPSLFSIIQTAELHPDLFGSLRNILLAGEKVIPNSLKRWYEVFGDRIGLVNMYGPTETTLAKLFYRISPEDVKKQAIPIGMPIKGAQAIVLNEQLKPCARGTVGEICIRTPYRTKGYYHDEALTNAKFIQNPFSQTENDLIFRTGDLGRMLPDGNIVYEGRIDRQVKIRGFRVELSAIENTLLQDSSVREAAVVYQNDEHASLLKAFVVPAEGSSVDEKALCAFLAKELPDYMIPNKVFVLESLPMTANNKLDYKALTAYTAEQDTAAVSLPQTETEQRVYEIYCSLLNREQLSVDETFFALGGNSLNSMALIGEIQRNFELELPLGIIFEDGSVRGIAAFIDSNRAPASGRIEHIADCDAYPVTSAQKRIFVLDQMIGENTIYNLPNVIRVSGAFDMDVFRKALRDIVQRHEALRTTFFVEDGQIFQRVHADLFPEAELEQLGGRNIDDVIDAFIQPFDLEKGPLIRAKAVQERDDLFYLMFDIHHIAADGTSIGIFTREIMQLCAGKTLDVLEIQYRDYAKWQNDNLSGAQMQQMEAYWTERFSGEIPVLEFPADHPRPLIKTYHGDKTAEQVDHETVSEIRRFAKRLNVSEFSVYYAAFLILLHKYTGQNDLIVGTPVQGRNHYQIQDLIGMFVNTLPLRSRMDPADSTVSFIRNVQYDLKDDFENSDYQLDDLIEHLDLVRDTSRNPLFDIVFGYHNYDVSGIQMQGIRFEPYDIKRVSSKFDMEFDIIDRNQNVSVQIEYCTDLFDRETVERVMQHYGMILRQITADDLRIKDVALLPADAPVFPAQAYDQIDYPQSCVHELFEAAAAKYPERIALTMDGQSMTYAELNRKANQIAARLVGYGVGANDFVPILAQRSFEMIIGILAAVKAGGAYVPISPAYPQERIDYMLEQVHAKVILKSEPSIRISSDPVLAEIPVLDLSDAALYTGDGQNLVHSNDISDLLYVIFTSGTTGQPKGVMIQHFNLVRLLFNDQNLYDFNEHDVWMMFHEFCFDFSVWELFGALLNGGRLVLLSRETVRDTYAVAELVKNENVTVFNQVPSAFYNYIKVSRNDETALRYLIFGGEKLIPSKIREWCSSHPNVRTINMYGITETTVHVTYKELLPADLERDLSNIGRAIPTLKVYILKGDELCGIGVPGELCVAGAGLARGYLGNETLTAQKFVDNPVCPGERLYRSGDLARWLPDGEIEYLGRIDEQVQLRGFRIEMGEIESKLREYAPIRDAVAAVKEHDTESYLTAYYVADEEIPSQTLRAYLMERLPEYMVPQFFVRIERISLTVNGKTDKRALPDPKYMEKESSGAALPETEMEQELSAVWSRVLGVKADNVNENFFLLGGDSIKALQVVSELKKDNYTTKVDLLFHYQTIRELAPHIEVLAQTAEQGLVQGETPLLPIQSWFLNRDSDPSHWNQAVLMETEEDIDEDCLEGALQSVVLHHDALRTVFRDDHSAYIRGMEGELFALEVEEADGCCDAEHVLSKANEVHRSFDLQNGPLVKAVLFKDTNVQKLFLCVHHLVVDSVSWRILIEDLLHAYRAILQDEEAALPLKTDSVKAWAEGIRKYWNREQIDTEVLYWNRLAKADSAKLRLPAGCDTDSYSDSRKLTRSLSAGITKELMTEANVAYQTETQDLLLSALAVTLSEWNGGDRFFVNLEGHGREDIAEHLDITRTVGWFTSFYPVLLDSRSDDWGTLIKSTKEMIRHIPNKGIGYGILNELTDSPYRGAFDIRPEIAFSFFGDMNTVALDESFRMEDMHYGELIGQKVTRPFRLDITAHTENGCLMFEVNYNQVHFEESRIEALLDMLCGNVQEITEHCMGKESIEYTPDDFGSSDLSMDELAYILEAGDAITVG